MGGNLEWASEQGRRYRDAKRLRFLEKENIELQAALDHAESCLGLPMCSEDVSYQQGKAYAIKAALKEANHD